MSYTVGQFGSIAGSWSSYIDCNVVWWYGSVALLSWITGIRYITLRCIGVTLYKLQFS